MTGDDELLSGFVAHTIDTTGASLHVRVGGKGPPLVLLHGYPQTLLAWHRVAPRLAERFTVIVPDLRGYGRSSCPPSDAAHRAYSKQAMALDIAVMMQRLGFTRFAVMGHDRGARVAYRLALDRPALVARLIVVDILPSWDQWQPVLASVHRRIVHWAFLAQPTPIPETLIREDPSAWIEGRLRRGTRAGTTSIIAPAALEDYRRSLSDPDRIHATCEDFRAGASCDVADDQADRFSGHTIACPTMLIWGSAGTLSSIKDPLAIWAPWCRSIEGRQVVAGHYIPEENPDALLDAALPFLAAWETGR